MARRSVAILCLVAAALAGCQPQDHDRAREAARAFLTALDRGDGAAACRRLSEAGVSELLLLGIEHDVSSAGLSDPAADRCALVAERLDAQGVASQARVTAVNVEGDRATIRTDAGPLDLEEREGRWRVARMEAVARILDGETQEPAHIAVVRPALRQPALGAALAGRVASESVEITGTLAPVGARLEVGEREGATVESVEARDGRLRVRLRLRRGDNVVVLRATAPDRRPAELALRIERP